MCQSSSSRLDPPPRKQLSQRWNVGELWQQGFAKYQPGIRISYFLPTSALAFAALYYNQGRSGHGPQTGLYDLLAYERVMNFDPVEITAVTGSFDVGGWRIPSRFW